MRRIGHVCIAHHILTTVLAVADPVQPFMLHPHHWCLRTRFTLRLWLYGSVQRMSLIRIANGCGSRMPTMRVVRALSTSLL